MGLGVLVRRDRPVAVEERFGLEQYLTDFVFNAQRYIVPGGMTQSVTARLAADAYEANGPIGALVSVRSMVFSEVRFLFQSLRSGRPAELFGNADLGLLESPWPGGSTRSLLGVMEVDGSLAGNGYFVAEQSAFGNGRVLTRLDPSRTLIVTADVRSDGITYGRELRAYAYQESPGSDSVLFLPEEIVHFKPLPDREMPQFRGKSWMSNVLSDVNADQDMVTMKRSFVKNAVMPSLVFTFDPTVTEEQFKATVDAIKRGKTGPERAGEALYLGGGVDPKVVATDLKALSIKDTQGAGETRLAAAAGVPVPIVGFSEGLAGSALNAGNYSASRRRFADGTMRPLWHEAAAALASAVRVPAGSRLWYDDRDVSFLQEDVMDAAEIMSRQASTIEMLIRSGFTPDTAASAVDAGGDWSKLVHTGLYSVQLQPPGAETPAP